MLIAGAVLVFVVIIALTLAGGSGEDGPSQGGWR